MKRKKPILQLVVNHQPKKPPESPEPPRNESKAFLRKKLRQSLRPMSVEELREYLAETTDAVLEVLSEKDAAKRRARTRSHIRASSCDDDEE